MRHQDQRQLAARKQRWREPRELDPTPQSKRWPKDGDVAEKHMLAWHSAMFLGTDAKPRLRIQHVVPAPGSQTHPDTHGTRGVSQSANKA